MPKKQNNQQQRSKRNGSQNKPMVQEKVVVNQQQPTLVWGKVRSEARLQPAKPQNRKLGKMPIMPTNRNPVTLAMAALCLPGSYVAPGLPSKFGSSTTSTAAPKRIGALTTQNVTGFGGLKTQSWFAVSRNPLLASMYTQRGCPSFRYDEKYASTTSANDEPILQDALQFEIANIPTVGYASITLSPDPFSTGYTAYGGLQPSANTVAPYGTEAYCLNALGHRWFFNGAGSPVKFHALIRSANGTPIDPDTAGVTQSVMLYQLTGPDTEVFTSSMTFIDGELGWQEEISERGWYRYSILMTATADFMDVNGTTFTFKSWTTCEGDSSSWSIVTSPLPELIKETTIHALRVTGASMLLTNTTPELTRGGFFRTFQFQPRDDFMTFIDSDDPLGYLSDIQGPSDPHSFRNGTYAWMRPGNIESYELQNIFARDTTGKVYGHNIPVFHSGGWLVTVVEGPEDAQTVSTTASYSIEFVSRSYWYGPVTSRLTSSEWDGIVDRMFDIEQVTENPIHLKEIGNAIMNIARGITPALPYVAKAVSLFSPTTGAVLGAVSDALNKRTTRSKKKRGS